MQLAAAFPSQDFKPTGLFRVAELTVWTEISYDGPIFVLFVPGTKESSTRIADTGVLMSDASRTGRKKTARATSKFTMVLLTPPRIKHPEDGFSRISEWGFLLLQVEVKSRNARWTQPGRRYLLSTANVLRCLSKPVDFEVH